MNNDTIIAAIDAEIGKLQEVRALLSGVNNATPVTKAAPAKKSVRRKLSVTLNCVGDGSAQGGAA